jgi:hypothetical protein
LAFSRYTRDPAGTWKNAITSHSKDKTGGGYYSDCCILQYPRLEDLLGSVVMKRTYEPECDDANDVHENVAALSEDQSV